MSEQVNERYAVVENVVQKPSDEIKVDGELSKVKLPIAAGPFETRQEAVSAANTDWHDYSVIGLPSKQVPEQ